jgi:hypothetical protein
MEEWPAYPKSAFSAADGTKRLQEEKLSKHQQCFLKKT